MPLPVILIDSATGSDTQASGAGPSTALFGATGVTAGDGLTVDLSADAPDLSGVATDGSAVLFMSDTNAGSRNFSKITAVDNGTKIVTVADAFQASNTDAWAIGGKLASLFGTTSYKLVENNSAAGDAMPGWTMEFQSGHSETRTSTSTIGRRSGDTTGGPIVIRGAAGAATTPIITFSNNGAGFSVINGSSYWQLHDFEIRNSNATKTASVAIQAGGTSLSFVCRGLKIDHATDKFWRGFSLAPYGTSVEDCEIANCASHGIIGTSSLKILNNWIHDCGGDGINLSGNVLHSIISHNVIADNTGNGILIGLSGSTASASHGVCQFNTIDGNDGDGIEITSASTNYPGLGALRWLSNLITNNGGYGINFSGASVTDILLHAYGTRFRGNCYYNNTSGDSNLTLTLSEDQKVTGTDPGYTNAAGGDYSIGTALKARGYPLAGTLNVGKYSNTESHVDPGAAQREEPAGGGTLVIPRRRFIR